jgi:hypothetical protein
VPGLVDGDGLDDGDGLREGDGLGDGDRLGDGDGLRDGDGLADGEGVGGDSEVWLARFGFESPTPSHAANPSALKTRHALATEIITIPPFNTNIPKDAALMLQRIGTLLRAWRGITFDRFLGSTLRDLDPGLRHPGVGWRGAVLPSLSPENSCRKAMADARVIEARARLADE